MRKLFVISFLLVPFCGCRTLMEDYYFPFAARHGLMVQNEPTTKPAAPPKLLASSSRP